MLQIDSVNEYFKINSRRDRIRTCDFYVPNVALYQAEPHAANMYIIITWKKKQLFFDFFIKVHGFSYIKEYIFNISSSYALIYKEKYKNILTSEHI